MTKLESMEKFQTGATALLQLANRNTQPFAILAVRGFFINNNKLDENIYLMPLLWTQLKKYIRDSDLCFREEQTFYVTSADINDNTQIKQFAERLIELLATTYVIEGQEYKVGIDIGISGYPQDASSIAELITHSKKALQALLEKESTVSQYSFY